MAKHRSVKRVNRSIDRQTTVAVVPRHPAPIALAVSAVALQVALGAPLFIGGYTRSAYAATSCTYTPSGSIGPTTAINCTVQSGTETQAQMLYSGARLFSTSGDTFNGLNMDVTNLATITLSGTPQNWTMAPVDIPGQNTVNKTGLGALYVGSRGSTSYPNGGNGVSGGNGGTLTLTNNAIIDPGNYGYGILVASVGGPGMPKTGGTQPAGSGGAGGDVYLHLDENLYGTTTTNYISSGSQGGPAVYAASIGGAAGLFNGDYGKGGAGGNVGILVSGTQIITTQGPGNGNGMIIPGVAAWPSGAGIKGLSRAGPSAFNAKGSPGDGVYLHGTGTAIITTNGNDSPGIYLVSEGGYGQNGGGGSGANCGGNCTGGAGGGVAVRGVLGSNVYFNASILTGGNYSSGLVAQSLGGPGANGRTRWGTKPNIAAGGAASTVAVYLAGTGILTSGASSHGIVAQSLGAGGGVYSGSAGYVGDQNPTSAGGESVIVQNQGNITVSGNTSHGILAQSIGGAGGSVYASNSDGATIGGQSAYVHGNSVTVVNAGNVTTGNQANGTGTGSIGILAQSIGGGGGNATSAGILHIGQNGSAGGKGSNGGGVTVDFNQGASGATTLRTFGIDAPGIQAQSIGGGGGNGRNKTGLWAAVGGAGGAGGAGGIAVVNLNQGTSLGSYGDYSDGILVQSVGGGGGSGGKATAWGTTVAYAMGGSGGAGGAGGSASVYLKGASLSTQGLQAQGIVVHSIGGGGGSGGASKANAVGILTIASAHGGTGGTGGSGGTANASVSGGVTTYGYDSTAVVVQSVGGGGGNGASSAAHALSFDVPIPDTEVKVGAALSFSTGGSGGSAGNGGKAYAVNAESNVIRILQQDVLTSSNGVNPSASGSNTIAKGTAVQGITTFGDGAAGMLVQSIGGGGGNGGDSTAVASAGVLQEKWENIKTKVGDGDDDGGASFNFARSVSHGGSGSSGGDGSTATGLNQGIIHTYGMFGDAIIVQSIGGGGGNGGSGNAKSSSAGYGVSLSHALGGSGSVGGAGGTAFGGNASGASIQTSGNNARGILVQSIGGGGGNAGGGAGTSSASFGLTLAHGNSGSSGGDGGEAYASNQGTITTQGDWSDGILAQSVGGGGGNGGAGDSSLTVPSGQQFSNMFSSDDSTSDASSQTASNVGTKGKNAQPTTPDTFTLSLGASGGTGGNGGGVIVGFAPGTFDDKTAVTAYKPQGHIKTSGTLSHGILAQSIGGGGGNAAASSGSSSATMNLYLGASGGNGGYGQAVRVFANDITTAGFSSHGIVAQSIGGGGGTGVASGISKTIKTKLGTKTIDPKGTATTGFSGDGGFVYVNSFGTIVTGSLNDASATDSFGILAQSIGGGGGMAAAAQGSSTAASGQGSANSIGISLGSEGFTGDGGGADVFVTHNGQIKTYGTRNMGIVAQSVGGGGGLMSGSESTLSAVTFNTPQTSGNANTNGGNVAVSLGQSASGLPAWIQTYGAGAIGILAQSVGGGGGFAADATQAFTPVAGATPGGSNGYGGAVTVTLGGGSLIQTRGDNAHGIFAQTVGGSGGVWDNGAGTSAGSLQGPNASAQVGQIAITVDGSISASGYNPWGILAQSAGVVFQNATPITVTINSGASVYGRGGAVWMHSQGTNTLTNNGTVTGNVQNNNHGLTATPTPWDSVNHRLAAIDWVPQTGSQFINNGLFNSGDLVSGITLTNNGALNVGGSGQFQTTRFDHHLVGSGRVLMDIDQVGGRADRIDVVGAITPGPAGAMPVSFNIQSMKPGVELELVRAGVMDAGALNPVDPIGFDFNLAAPDAPGGWHRLQADSRFAAALGIGGANLIGISRYLDQAWESGATGDYNSSADWGGGATMNDVFTALAQPTDQGSFDRQITQFLANTVMSSLTMNVLDAFDLAGNAIGCPGFGASGTQLHEQECVWADIKISEANQDSEPGVRGYQRKATDLAIGGQMRLNDAWFLSGSVAYQDGDYRSDDRAEQLDTTAAALAFALTYQLQDWAISGALGGGQVWGDGNRVVGLGAQTIVANASPGSSYLFARGRVAYEWGNEQLYVRPLVDLDLIQVELDAYREHGAGAASLAVDGTRETIFAATPAVEIGARLDREGMIIRPYGALGVTMLSTDELSTRAQMIGAPGLPSYRIDQPIPDVLGRFALGAEFQSNQGFGVSLQYGLAFGDGFDDQSGYLEASYRF